MTPDTDTAPSAAPADVGRTLFVVPSQRRGGFHASIRGRILELASPDPGHALAPTPQELLIASIASDAAWAAQTFLRARGLPDSVSVSGTWHTLDDPPRLAQVDVTVLVADGVDDADPTLIAAVERGFAAGWLNAPLNVRIEGRAGRA